MNRIVSHLQQRTDLGPEYPSRLSTLLWRPTFGIFTGVRQFAFIITFSTRLHSCCLCIFRPSCLPNPSFSNRLLSRRRFLARLTGSVPTQLGLACHSCTRLNPALPFLYLCLPLNSSCLLFPGIDRASPDLNLAARSNYSPHITALSFGTSSGFHSSTTPSTLQPALANGPIYFGRIALPVCPYVPLPCRYSATEVKSGPPPLDPGACK